MFKDKYNLLKFFFITSIILLSFTSIGFSYFQYISNSDTKSINEDFSHINNEEKTLNITPVFLQGLDTRDTYLSPTSGQVVQNKETLNISESNLNSFKSAIEANTNDTSLINFFKSFATEKYSIKNGKIKNTIKAGKYSAPSKNKGKVLIVDISSDLTYTSELGFFDTKESYGGSVSLYLQENFFRCSLLDKFNPITLKFIDTVKVSTVESFVLKELNRKDPSTVYSINAFYQNFDNGVISNQLNDSFFNENSNFFVALYTPIQEEIGKYSITDTINSASSGTHDFYINNPTGQAYNILNDYTYNQLNNSFNLGFSNTATTIANGVTINFALNNDGYKHDLSNTSNPPSAPSFANPDTQNGSKQYTVKLINDLYVNGTLNLHAVIGNNTSTNMQSSINGRYVNLDLNGHNIYISNSGILNSYGIIMDSVGTGLIHVFPGGQLSSYVTIEDYKSGTSTTALVDEKIFPFTNYLFPYLRCKVYIECTKSSQGTISSGILNGIVSLKLVNDQSILGQTVEVPIAHMVLNFIGTSDNTFFKINDVLSNDLGESGVHLDFNFNKNTDFLNFLTSSNEFRYLTTLRNKWTFQNIDITLSKLTMDVAGALGGFFETLLGIVGTLPSIIYTDEYIFPLPAYFDLNFINSKFHFSQPVQILPGASLYFDENSYVYLEYTSSRSAGLYSSGESVNIFKNDTFINNRRTSTATSDLSSAPLFNTQSIWRYSNQPTINCLGTIVFTKGNNASLPYILTGAVSFNRVATCDNGGTNLQTLNVPKNQLFSTLKNNNINVKTYSYFIYPGNENMSLKSYTLPLISYDSAYIYNCDGSYDLFGNYNQDNGIFTNQDGSHYFFLNDTTFSLNNSNTTPTKLESFDSSLNYLPHNGSNYVYFGGCYWPATSLSGNTATINITKANNSSTSANVSYNTSNKLWLK